MTVQDTLIERVIEPQRGTLPAEAARYFLTLEFTAVDRARVKELSAKARDGALASAEQEELDGYLFLNDWIALLQSKARLSLQNTGTAA